MTYYLKKCGHQELGSVTGDGRPKRGRYLLTSKKVLSFFPPLTTAQKNDSALLTVIPLYSGDRVYCQFVYHNDKYNGSMAKHPRDEYRIYLSRALEENGHTFVEGDILIFRKEDSLLENGEVQTVYYLMHVSDRHSALYRDCDGLIQNSRINGGYALAETVLAAFEEKLLSSIGRGFRTVKIDERVTANIEQQDYDKDKVAKLFNSVSFRDFVMTGYENLCAVTRSAIKCDSFTNLEAAHIRPKSHQGLYLPSNGIALTRDFHWAFDKGFFTIDDDYRVKVHHRAESEYLQSFDKKEIFVPANSFFAPDTEYLRYHQENIFGLFLTSGRL